MSLKLHICKILIIQQLFSNFFLSFFFRRVNVSHFGDRGKCWNELLTQKTYVILLQPNYSGKGHNAIFKARYDEPLGAAIDFSLEMERKLLKAMGTYISRFRIFLKS